MRWVVLLALFSNTELRSRFEGQPDHLDHIDDPVVEARPVRQYQHRLTESEIDQLVERYQAGATIPDLVAEFTISRDTAMKHLERRGVPRRACKPMLTGKDLARAHQLYEQGLSLAQVGQRFGVHGETVRRAFTKADLEVRPRP